MGLEGGGGCEGEEEGWDGGRRGGIFGCDLEKEEEREAENKGAGWEEEEEEGF